MTKDKPGFHKVIEDFLRDRRRSGLAPPQPEELLNYIEGELGDAEATEFQQRLVLDRESIDTLLAFELLPEDPELKDHPALSEAAHKAAWEDMKNRIREDRQAFQEDGESPVAKPIKGISNIVPILLAAACILLGLYGISLRRQLDEMLRPTFEAKVVDVPMGLRDSRESPLFLQGWQVLRFELSHRQTQFLRYRVDLIRESDRLVIFSEQTEPGAQPPFELLLPRPFFKELGTYKVAFVGEQDGQDVPLSVQTFRVVP